MPGTDTLIVNQNSEGEGEICFRGRNIFMGYLADDKATQEAIDPDGFLHSGDLGKVDKEGFLYITGRAKELLITAGGENVAPIIIESVIRQELPIVSNCMVVGDRKKYLSVLICLHTTRDDHDNPTQTLAPEVLRAIEPIGSKSKTTVEAAEDPLVNKMILAGLERANKRAISRYLRHWRYFMLLRCIVTGVCLPISPYVCLCCLLSAPFACIPPSFSYHSWFLSPARPPPTFAAGVCPSGPSGYWPGGCLSPTFPSVAGS